MNLTMWEELKAQVPQDIVDIMERIERENDVSVDPKFVNMLTEIFDVDGVVEMDVIFEGEEPCKCVVYYDPDSDNMKDMHWNSLSLLRIKAADILFDTEYYVDFVFRRKKKQSWKRGLRSVW